MIYTHCIVPNALYRVGDWCNALCLLHPTVLANDAVGTRRDLMPSHDEAYLDGLKKAGKADAKDDYATYLHGMDEVIDATEKQKREDEAALKDCMDKGTP